MAFVVITSDTEFVYIEFNLAATEWSDAKVRRTDSRSVCTIVEDKGVEIIWDDGSKTILKHEYVDSIDGDENITSNLILRDKLRALM